MTEINHAHLLAEIERLKLSDKLRLLEELAAMIRRNTTGPAQTRSIMELKGKGKNIWKNIDVKDYLNKERYS